MVNKSHLNVLFLIAHHSAYKINPNLDLTKKNDKDDSAGLGVVLQRRRGAIVVGQVLRRRLRAEHHRGRHAGRPQQGVPERHGHQGGRGHHQDTQVRVEKDHNL